MKFRMCIATALCAITPIFAVDFQGGSGTAEDPYQIGTAADLILLGETPEHYDKAFILCADIDLSDYVFEEAVVAPIHSRQDTVKPPFTGRFDGQGHVIRHLRIQGDSFLGLFGLLDHGAVILNLGLEDVNIRGHGDIGGLAGQMGDLDSRGAEPCRIWSCYSTGLIHGESWHIGGLVGQIDLGHVSLSYSSAEVVGKSYVGGLIGRSTTAYIWSCFSNGSVSGDHWVGGLLAKGFPRTYIKSCYSAGDVSAKTAVGGLVVSNEVGKIQYCYSTATVSLKPKSDGIVSEGSAAGLVVVPETVVVSSFWDREASGQDKSGAGEGLSTSQMQDIRTYLEAGWDFHGESLNGTGDYWCVEEGAYPSLAFFSDSASKVRQGEGTPESPYLIADANDLGAVWHHPQAHCKLTSNIDLAGITWNIPVVPWFEGHFDGNGFSISNLHIEGSDYLGLFGTLDYPAEITDLNLDSVRIRGIWEEIGGLAGRNQSGTISSCSTSGLIESSRTIGGLTGFNSGNIVSCYSTIDIEAISTIGGLVGYNKGSIITSYSSGTVGLALEAKGSFVGGLVGNNTGSISSCYSMSPTHGFNYVGGLVGGGLPSTDSNKITGCFSAGRVTGSEDTGGLVGLKSEHVSSSFWDTQTSVFVTSGGGKGLPTSKMQNIETYLDAGWDFEGETENGTEDIWLIDEGNDYPRLWWELPPAE